MENGSLLIVKIRKKRYSVGKRGKIGRAKNMGKGFFSGSYAAKLDVKSRFVLPQSLRYQLVENGELQFSIGLSMGGCLAIYKQSEIEALVQKFQKKKACSKVSEVFYTFFLHSCTNDM